MAGAHRLVHLLGRLAPHSIHRPPLDPALLTGLYPLDSDGTCCSGEGDHEPQLSSPVDTELWRSGPPPAQQRNARWDGNLALPPSPMVRRPAPAAVQAAGEGLGAGDLDAVQDRLMQIQQELAGTKENAAAAVGTGGEGENTGSGGFRATRVHMSNDGVTMSVETPFVQELSPKSVSGSGSPTFPSPEHEGVASASVGVEAEASASETVAKLTAKVARLTAANSEYEKALSEMEQLREKHTALVAENAR